MLDPMKKGALSFHSSVDVRGYQRVNVLAAIYLIMYGKEQEEKFAKADIKKAGQLWGNMFMKNIQPVINRKDAIREVYANLLEQSERAKQAFDELTSIECTDAELAEVLAEFKSAGVVVPSIEEVVESAEVVSEPVEEEAEEAVEEPAEEASTETVEEVESAEEPKAEWVEPSIEEVENAQGETEIAETVVAETTEQVEVAEENALADLADAMEDSAEEPREDDTDDVASEFTATVVEAEEEPATEEVVEEVIEEVAESKPVYNEDLVIVEEESKYRKALSGKLADEVRDFKTMANAYTATKLCNKILKLIPDEALLDLIYNKEVVHILYEEFAGAAYLLSSFRVLAVGIATGGK